jgi:hypothetical protein
MLRNHLCGGADQLAEKPGGRLGPPKPPVEGINKEKGVTEVIIFLRNHQTHPLLNANYLTKKNKNKNKSVWRKL